MAHDQFGESILICVLEGALGFLLSSGSTAWFAHHWQQLPRANAIHMDGSVLAFSIVLVFVAALVAGMVPAISTTAQDLLGMLQDSARSIGGSDSRAGLRRIRGIIFYHSIRSRQGTLPNHRAP